jgi:2-C-methyl-D-erythritol 2,4-cyclodiphosphate synthase
MRVGIGYDVHRLEEGRRLILGGAEIPFEKGLLGHSDADVLVHAIMDALLGAAGLDDIGMLFPDTDESYKDAPSVELLKTVAGMLEERCCRVENIDSVIVAQQPKLSPFYGAMKANIAEALNIEASRVSVKATTEEGLGFTGQGLGIAAHAVVLIEKDD